MARKDTRTEVLLRHSKAHVDAARIAAKEAGYASYQHFLRECTSRLINGQVEAGEVVEGCLNGPSTEEALKACVIADEGFAQDLASAAEEEGLKSAAASASADILPSETRQDMRARILQKMKGAS